MKDLTVVKVEVGQEPEVVTIPNTLEAMHEIVGGYMQTVKVSDDILLVVDEEGLLKGSEPNFVTGYSDGHSVRITHEIVGNAFFVSWVGAEFHTLDKLQINQVLDMFRFGRHSCIATK